MSATARAESAQNPPSQAPTPSCEQLWAAQLACPRGLTGSVLGRIAGYRNRPMNAWVASALEVSPSDRVLEVGFGCGYLVQAVAAGLRRGVITGVDASEAMLDQARARNTAGVRDGRVHLMQGDVHCLPFGGAAFHKVCAVDTYAYWDEPALALSEIYRVLRPLGRLVLALRCEATPDETADASASGLSEICARLGHAGFVEVRCEHHPGDASACHSGAGGFTLVHADKPYFVAACDR